MDYKKRNPMALPWRRRNFYLKEADPFGIDTGTRIREIESPDRTAKFLMLQSGFDESNPPFWSFYHFCVEVIPGNKIWCALEDGTVSWLDFWHHRGWLLELKYTCGKNEVPTRYIHPSQMPVSATKRLESLGSIGVYERKRRYLERCCSYHGMTRGEKRKAEKDYAEFMLKHGHRFTDKAA